MSTKTYRVFDNELQDGYETLELTRKDYLKLKKDIELHNRDCAPDKIKRIHITSEPQGLVVDETTGDLRVKTPAEKLSEAIITLEDYKDIKIEEAKKTANESILAVFPDYKQRNIANDGEAATIRFAEVAGDTYSGATQKISPKIDETNNDKESLENIFDDPSTIDITDIISVLDPSIQPYATAYTHIKLQSIAAYMLVRAIRDWENDKKSVIQACSSEVEVDAISLDDCPVLNITT